MTNKTEPTRTCVGCRSRHSTQDLLRVRLHDGSLVFADAVHLSGGRGAWLCRETLSTCATSAARTKAFDRAFRSRVETGSIEHFLSVLAGHEPHDHF